jgi:hypothetical protein
MAVGCVWVGIFWRMAKTEKNSFLKVEGKSSILINQGEDCFKKWAKPQIIGGQARPHGARGSIISNTQSSLLHRGLDFVANPRSKTSRLKRMESNIIIGIIIIVIGTLFLAVAAVNPENFIVYEVLKGAYRL